MCLHSNMLFHVSIAFCSELHGSVDNPHMLQRTTIGYLELTLLLKSTYNLAVQPQEGHLCNLVMIILLNILENCTFHKFYFFRVFYCTSKYPRLYLDQLHFF